MLPCPIGSLICGYLTDRIGRKGALQVAFVPTVISMFLLCYAKSMPVVYCARMLSGISFGTGGPIFAYIAETSPTKWRPFFFMLFNFYVGLGMTMAAALGIFFHWTTISFIYGVLSIIGFLMPFAIPETPAYLRFRGLEEEAKVSEEWFGFKLPAKEPIVTPNENSQHEIIPDSFWKQLKLPIVWKPAVIVLLFFICQQGSGFYPVMFYSVDVLHDCMVTVDPTKAGMLLAGSRTFASVFNLVLQAVPKKTLTVASGTGMFLMLVGILTYLHIFTGVVDPPYSDIVLYAFMIFVFFSMFAILPLPWSICSEIFPISVKGTMTGILYSVGYELMFLGIKIYPTMVHSLGAKTVWTIYGSFCFSTILFGAFIMPETTGKTLDEIQENFDRHPKKKQNKTVSEEPKNDFYL
ncbi:facilitated trehalose transporter Tret1-like isoform X2 [Daktulosphaira vitifoliae]|nr:facilitated trehalose transporter Tret1-like isoform X2 [Daktulosphaira vitifoliae]